MMMRSPNQNSGIEYVNRVNASIPWSYVLPRRHPWRIPIQMPSPVEASVDSPISRIVGQIRPAITWETGRL